MVYSELFGSPRNPFEPRSLPPPPHEDRAENGCSAALARVLRRQSHTRISAADTPDTIKPDEIFERSRERREQRKLKRASALVKPQTINFNPSEAKTLGYSHTSKPRPPPYTLVEITNQLNAPRKLTRKPPNYTVPNGWYQSNSDTSLAAPAGSRQTSSTSLGSQIPYSESRGELQRQYAIGQRLLRKHQPGSPNPTEVGAYLGGLERLHDEDGWVDGFRLEVEKPLQRVYAQRLQGGNRGSVIRPEKPTKVRFAPVVECFEF